MAAVVVLLAAGLAVLAAIAYAYLPSNKKMKLWLCSFLRKVTFLPMEAVRVAAAAAAEEEEKEKKKKKKKKEGVVAVAVDRAQLESVFATFDKNGDGYITVAELEESLRKLGLSTTHEEVVSMVEKLDANGDGLLDLEEFWVLYSSIGGGTAMKEEEPDGCVRIEREGEATDQEEERDLKEAFDVFDGNRDGLITVEELGMVLAALGLAPGATEARCREMIKKVDLDGDGMVSFEEFKQMMRGAKDRKLF